MSREAALAKATGQPAPTTPTTNPGGLVVSARQAARIPVPKPDAAAPAAPTPEVPSTVPAAAEPPKDLDSDRFAHLAKKEAVLQKERETIRAEREAAAKEKAAYEEVRKKYQEFETLRQKDPIEAMKLAGFSDTDIFNYYAKAQEEAKLKDTPEAKAAAAVDAKIKEFEDKQAKAAAEAKAKADAEVIQRYKGTISKTVAGNKDKFEYCNFYGPVAESLIYETVEATFNETGEVLTPMEAAEMVEKYYEDDDKAKHTLKKRSPGTTNAITGEPLAPEPPPPASKTLTNRVSPTVGSTIPVKETREQKRERLIKNIQEHGLRK